jgi:formate dehydrogenase iron-sulfur subunit
VRKGTLIDTTKCIGCRSCQVTCKQWNDLPAEKTSVPDSGLGLQNPKVLSSKSFVVVSYNEVEDDNAPGGLRYIFAKRQCMHCDEPACAAACPVTALHKTELGPVVYDSSKCIGCRYCEWACPFGAPTAQWDSLAPKIRKCTECYDRVSQALPIERNGKKLTDAESRHLAEAYGEPACVKQCPSGCLMYDDREELLKLARERIKSNPSRYVNHIYGEHEAGGTDALYLASVPFEKLRLPRVQNKSYADVNAMALSSVPPAVIGVGAVLGGASLALSKRKAEVAQAQFAAAQATADRGGAPVSPKKPADTHHPEFAPVGGFNPKSTWNMLLTALVAFSGLSFLLRFALGLGGSTNLSDTYAWGLWIVLDLIWIAIAAGAFATAGLIYVFRREDLYSIGRSAVLMGLLSYTFVVVTLLADLGLPWHFYQLGMQAPKHSAMFEVAWCVFLYLTVLAFEFMPVPFERWGLKGAMAVWRKYFNAYVVVAVSLFVYLLSRKLAWTAAAFVLFAVLAYLFRAREGQQQGPVMLAIAAVTLSTMHQSSLGSLFLLMPDKLNALWWSPIMPIYFFLSSIAGGVALMILVEMWVARVFKRTLYMAQLAAMGQIAFWGLLLYEMVRLGDVAYRWQFAALTLDGKGLLFLAEVVLGGVIPLTLLSTNALRQNACVLGAGALLCAGGVVFNRANEVIFAMTLKGPMPQIAPAHYFPSLWEWGISAGLVAATIYLFGMGVRFLPVLPKQEGAAGD